MRDEIIKGLRDLDKACCEIYKFNGYELKSLILKSISVFDNVASAIIHEKTTLERDYLTISRSRIVSDDKAEADFYNNYFYLKGLINKGIKRVDKDKILVKGRKRTEVMNNEDLVNALTSVKTVAERVILI